MADGPSANEGVLELKTAALTAGSLNRPEVNRERFEDGWYQTNDVMRRDEEGFEGVPPIAPGWAGHRRSIDGSWRPRRPH